MAIKRETELDEATNGILFDRNFKQDWNKVYIYGSLGCSFRQPLGFFRRMKEAGAVATSFKNGKNKKKISHFDNKENLLLDRPASHFVKSLNLTGGCTVRPRRVAKDRKSMMPKQHQRRLCFQCCNSKDRLCLSYYWKAGAEPYKKTTFCTFLWRTIIDAITITVDNKILKAYYTALRGGKASESIPLTDYTEVLS